MDFWYSIPIAQIRFNGICVYNETPGGNHEATYTARTGEVSEQQARRFKKYFQLLLYGSQVKTNTTKSGKVFHWRLNFLTLTLPGKPGKNDHLGKAFNLFLTRMKYEGFKNFIWRKELQPGTKNPHWHIVGNAWIHYEKLNKIWNESLKRHAPGTLIGYVKKYKNYYPPSTEVKAIKDLRGCMRYAAKYCSKKEKGKVEGNTFGVSRQLSRIKFHSVVLDTEVERAVNIGKKIEVNDFATFFSLPLKILERSISGRSAQEFQDWKKNLIEILA